MTMDFIYETPMVPKSDESHIACLIACEVVVYSYFVNYMAVEVSFLLFYFMAPFPNIKP
jgi:hypothetical protein